MVFGRACVLGILVKDWVGDSDRGLWKEKDCCVIEGKMSKVVGLKNKPIPYLVVNAGEAV